MEKQVHTVIPSATNYHIYRLSMHVLKLYNIFKINLEQLSSIDNNVPII